MTITLQLNDEQDRALESLARRDGVTKHEAAVRAIQAAVQQSHQSQVRELSTVARARYAKLLDRLGG